MTQMKKDTKAHKTQKLQTKAKMEIFSFEQIKIYICLAPQNDCLNLSFVKCF